MNGSVDYRALLSDDRTNCENEGEKRWKEKY
jgi:hypothetical protein